MLGQNIIAALRETSAGMVKEFRQHSGFLTSHLREVMTLPPRILQVELISLMGTVGLTTLTNPTNYNVPVDYHFELTGIRGCIEQPSDAVTENYTRLEFNLRNVGSKDVFGQPVNMGFLLGTELQPGQQIDFPRGLYVFEAGTTIKTTWSRRTGQGNWVGPDKDVGLLLIGNAILKG